MDARRLHIAADEIGREKLRKPEIAAEPWQRQDAETARAYAAFLRYRDMGPGRTLADAYRQASGKGKASAPSGQWTGWYAAHRWRERAEAWDAHLAILAQREREQEHLRQLDAYRARQRRLARRNAEAALLLLKRAVERLNTLATEELTPALLPAFVRAAAAVAEQATNAEAQALAVAELLTLLEKDTDR
jgi:hypothetical protein